MKRIILGLGVLLMLAQNGFARSDAEYDKLIAYQSSNVKKQGIRCEKESGNHVRTGNIQECIKAVRMIKQSSDKSDKKFLASELGNLGLMYHKQGDNLKAYKYYMEAARLGSTNAQRNLGIMCKESPWACK